MLKEELKDYLKVLNMDINQHNLQKILTEKKWKSYKIVLLALNHIDQLL